MITLRALLFNVLFFGGTALLCIVLLPLMLFGRKANQFVGHAWCRLIQFMLRYSVGMRKRFAGLENLPDGPCIIVAKHQSAWETLTFHTVVPDPAYILKKELTRIPLVGQFLILSAGSQALKDMIKGASKALEENRQVIIFPEGTRTPPGSNRPYHPGIFALYKAFPDTKVIPVALNSGMFWGRDSFMKYGGRVTMEFLPAMEPGLDRKTFMKEIKHHIDTRTRELEAEAQTEFNLPMLTSDDIDAKQEKEDAQIGAMSKAPAEDKVS